VDSTWETRDLPVLEAMVRHFDDVEVHRLDIDPLAAMTALPRTEVERALKALHEAVPPYIAGHMTAQASYPIVLSGVTERARRAVGQWPTPESWADRMTQALNEAADQEPNPEKKGLLRQTADVVGGIAREVIIRTATGTISGSL
jgi:hypothetical protein